MQLACGFSKGEDDFLIMQNQLAHGPEGSAEERSPGAANNRRRSIFGSEQETCLQQKCQGSAAYRKPHGLSEVGVLLAHQLHSELGSCLSRSLMPGKFFLWFWKPELVNREHRHRKVFLASAMFVNYAPLFTIRDFKGLQISMNKKVTHERDHGSGR